MEVTLSLSGYPGYVVLKARSATRVLADAVCRALDYPYDSRRAYFMRQLVSVWIERKGGLASPKSREDTGYVLNEDQRSPLSAFDFPFRLRRIRALVRATNELYDPTRHCERELPVNRAVLDHFKSNLEDVALAFEALWEDDEAIKNIVIDSLGSDDMLSAIDDTVAANTFEFDAVIDAHGSRIEGIYANLSRHFRDISDQQDTRVAYAILSSGGDLDSHSFQHIMESFVTFPFVDLIAFPLMAMADIEDLVEIEIMRISPRDTGREGVPPLESVALEAFQGFLDRDARDHDMRLGRIDGADRLIELLVAASSVDRHQPGSANQLRNLYLGKFRRAIQDGPET